MLHALEAVALVVAGAAIVCALIAWRLSQGPVGLDFMREELEEALADALSGDVVAIGEVQASWLGRDRLVGVVLTEVVVVERGGGILARAPRLEADLSVAALLRGDVAFSRLVVEGGEVSIIRSDTGRISAGLGGPDRVSARAVARPQGGPRSLVILREALEAGSMTHDLRELRLEGATLFVRDAVTGIDWKADDATLRLSRDASGVRAEASGAIATGAPATVLRVSARAAPGLRQALFEVELENAAPARLFPRDGPLAPLARVELPVSASASAAVDEARGLLAADLTVALGAGRVHAADRVVEVREARAHFSFDPARDVLTVGDATVESDLFAGRLRAQLDGLTSWLFGAGAGPYPVSLSGEDLRADARPIFARPLEIASLSLTGALDPAGRRLDLDTLEVRARDVAAALSGAARLERVSDGRLLPSVALTGPIDGEAAVEDVLDFWPVELADGARDWVAESVRAGRAKNVHVELDLPAEAIVAGRLDDEKLALSFEFEDAEAAFISTMSPLTAARGSALLRGNSFSLTLEAGEMAGLAFDSGFVEIPRLNPKGAIARFGGVARGEASDVLAFIDEPPLEFPSSYGVEPASVAGRGRVDVEIRRPMLVDVPAEDIGFSVSGAFEGVTAPTMLPGVPVTDAAVTVTATPERLEARARGRLGPAPAVIEWRESFADELDDSTRFYVETTLDASAFDAFGAPVRRVFTGQTDLVIDARGRGFDITSAAVDADLTRAGLTLPDVRWSKNAGEPASARVALSRRDDGGFVFSDAVLVAPGAAAEGRLVLAVDGRLEELDLERLEIARFVDARAHVSRGEDGAIVAFVDGSYADVRSVVRELSKGGGGMGAPLDLELRLDRATVANGADLEDIDLRLEHDGRRIRRLDLAAMGEGGAVAAQIDPPDAPGGARRLALSAADAGEALFMMFGAGSVRGGSLRARAQLPPLDAPEDAPTAAVVEVENFTLVGAPPLAQILAIGSLEGLANTLAGEGIRFNRLVAPIEIVDGRITLEEAHAAGQALGVTVSGVVDLDARTFDLEGVLVPAYGVNSALGAVPVIGDIFVSRRGEGVFGLTYSVEGPFEQTRVFVNPLSALAPGFLRRMFEPVEGAGARADSG